MISKINKIKNLGLVFNDYSRDPSLPDFKQCNLVYGWNGSGKTTFSRLFDVINGELIDGLEYEFENEINNKYKQRDEFPQKIRVFNQDYIQKNVELLKGRTNTITILLGEENKELLEAIDEDKKLLNGDSNNPKKLGKNSLLEKLKGDREQKINERGRKFTSIASTIGAAIGGNALRTYRKPQAENDFATLTKKAELSPADLERESSLINQKLLDKISSIELGNVWLEDDGEVELAKLVEDILLESKSIFKKTVESETVTRLVNNPDISRWIEEGLELHKKHKSSVCEYCQQQITEVRLEQLARHFSDEDLKMKSVIDTLLEKIQKVKLVINQINLPDKARLYEDKQKDYSVVEKRFKLKKKQILDEIDNLAKEVRQKKSETTKSLSLNSNINYELLIEQVDLVNKIISDHNKTTTDFEEVQKRTVKKLKLHYLSTIYDEVKKLDEEVEDIDEQNKKLSQEVIEIKGRISKNMAKVSSTHKACDILNEKLVTFLGRNELKFIPHTETQVNEEEVEIEVVTGYDIMRGDYPATHLSEGEKTAIAFVYFVVHLGDQDFDISKGIVVVDDPISSLDSNSLFQAFSFLKNAVTSANQVFIFTHSFEFLKLLINWRKGLDRRSDRTGYFMIKNIFPNDIRVAILDVMDKELCQYESEYHYLFKQLKHLRDELDGTIAKAYPIPNIARKVWETFLMFSVPNGEQPYRKMDTLKARGFDAQKLDAIYKFTNDQSHITGSGFDPALVPETQKVVGELFEIMELVAPDHFKIIDQATN